ncbi:MAG TPA: acyl-CoA dehydrogenase family protein [Polyangiales bacterium]|nr:acyl-CoA dehydrogenase family protein [Polyangiales bacterium]
MSDLDSFRTEIRSWLESAVPSSLRGRPMAMIYEGAGGEPEPANIQKDRARYLELMVERGYTAPTWPKEYGGGGLSNAQARVLQDELAQLKIAPAMQSMGLTMIGPTLLVHGTEAQKQQFLPKIVSGEQRWCQGFSEPGAGSDLASLRMSAKLDASGERYVINGSKIWTSGAQFSDWIFMLVRTDETSKHNGITFLLADMKTPGIEVKPIKLISGHSMFCEVFFNDVVAEARNVVGVVNQGWTVAKTLLNFERSGMGTGGLGGAARRGNTGAGIVALAKETVGEQAGKVADGLVRDQLASLLIDELALSLTVRRSAETAKATGAPGPEISMFKLCQSELGHRRDELMLRLRGTNALGWEGPGFASDDLAQTRMWLGAKATTIYGGTSEIQRNIIAKRVLKLPTGN